jgi:hypothetical protein
MAFAPLIARAKETASGTASEPWARPGAGHPRSGRRLASHETRDCRNGRLVVLGGMGIRESDGSEGDEPRWGGGGDVIGRTEEGQGGTARGTGP